MKGDEAAWQRAGQLMEQRMNALKLTITELSRLSKVSDTSIRGYFAGKRVTLANKHRGLCRALKWTSDSIDRIYAGLDPIELDAATADLVDQIQATNDRIDGMDSRLDQILTHLARLDSAIGAPRGDE